MKQSSVGGRAGKSSFSHQKVNPYSSRDQVCAAPTVATYVTANAIPNIILGDRSIEPRQRLGNDDLCF